MTIMRHLSLGKKATSGVIFEMNKSRALPIDRMLF